MNITNENYTITMKDLKRKTPKEIVEYARQNPHTELDISSECCGASQWLETDLCSECLEHTEFN